MTEQPYETKSYIAVALDPVHVGTGEMSIGRVDNPIARDPVSQVPKIPATSIAGVARAYTAMHYPDKFLRQELGADGKVTVYRSCVVNPLPRGGTRPGGGEEAPCAQPTCPVCVTYGFALPDGRALPSMAQFFDAQIVFFPVATMIGPVWLTAPEPLQSLVEAGLVPAAALNVQLAAGQRGLQTALKSQAKGNKLNLGWLLMNIAQNTAPVAPAGVTALQKAGVPAEVLNRLVLAPDELFGQLVNNNLEVRTSTAVSPLTGAALEGALYTYEAIPRATILSFSIVYKDPRSFLVDGQPLAQDLAWVKQNVEKGLAYVEYLGIGGMVSRGMGRLRING